MIPASIERMYTSKQVVIVVVYLSMFLDNILLTVVVPIIPDYLFTSEHQAEINLLSPYSQRRGTAMNLTNKSNVDCVTNKLVEEMPLIQINQTQEEKVNISFHEKVWHDEQKSEDYNLQAQSNLNLKQQVYNEKTKHSKKQSRLYSNSVVILYPYSREKRDIDSISSYKLSNLEKYYENKNFSTKEQTERIRYRTGYVIMKPVHMSTIRRSEHYLYKKEADVQNNIKASGSNISCNTSPTKTPHHNTPSTPHIFYARSVTDENGKVGLLLSSKALVQLVMNPVVGAVTANIGYQLPLFIGSINLLMASLLFAFGEQFLVLLFARSLQGIASACISVSGMCLVAEQFTDDAVRTRIMGIVLGSVALGVLLGYPFGSLFYDFIGKMAPFLLLSALVFINGAIQLFFLDLRPATDRLPINSSWYKLLSDGHVMLIAGSIWLSTSTMAILEPCIPIWLMENIKPQRWQLGMVFIPDSLGYLLGTNFFGTVAFHLGRWRVAVFAMMLVGFSSFFVPSARSVGELAVPHFCLGLGIGIVDAALVPLLASLVDSRYAAHYGSVYALQQMAVSLAYSLGPLVAGGMVRSIGFPWLMRTVGLLNLLYCPLLIFTSLGSGNLLTQETSLMTDAPVVNYKTTKSDPDQTGGRNLYRRFLNSEDSD